MEELETVLTLIVVWLGAIVVLPICPTTSVKHGLLVVALVGVILNQVMVVAMVSQVTTDNRVIIVNRIIMGSHLIVKLLSQEQTLTINALGVPQITHSAMARR